MDNKQKIVMKVQMSCEKSKAKAMKIASIAYGVTKVSVEGADKDQLVVIGDDMDSVKLTRSLRKKLKAPVTLASLQEEKEKEDDKKGKEQEKEAAKAIECCCVHCQQPPLYQIAYHPMSTSDCSIL